MEADASDFLFEMVEAGPDGLRDTSAENRRGIVRSKQGATSAPGCFPSGASAIVISTLATLVSVSATMKAVNITPQQNPDTHNAPPA